MALAVRQGKEIRHIRIRKEEIILSLFIFDIIRDIEKSKTIYRLLIKYVNFSKELPDKRNKL